MLGSVVFPNDDVDVDDIDSGTATFFDDARDLATKDLDSIILDLIILMKMILKLLLLSDLLIGVIDWNNVKHIGKDKQRIDAYSMVSNKSVALEHVKRWKFMNDMSNSWKIIGMF